MKALGPDFISSEQELTNAIESQDVYRMAQLLHPETMLKFDLFIVPETDYTRGAFERSRTVDDGFGPINVADPETTVLEKLRWYELGNRVSDRQWNDIVQVLEVQKGHLDLSYLNRWAAHFGVADLLELALQQVKSSSE